MDLILVASGGFFGAILRYIVSVKLNNKFPFKFFGTFLVNILGSFALGFLVNIQINTNLNMFLCIGFLGSFTTFSTFKAENISLVQARENRQFIIYLFLTYTIGILFAFIGFLFAKILF